MRFLLGTNVVSELRKRDRADAGLRRWIEAVEGDDLEGMDVPLLDPFEG